MARALERIAPDAVRCLRPGDSATATGDFEGSSGQYQITHLAASGGSVLSYAIETCVRVAAEHAHVRPFTDESAAFAYTFSAPPGTTSGEPAATPPASTPAPPVATPSNRVPIPQVTGSVEIASRPSPSEMIRREGDALQRCYEQACERDHTISGSIELHMTLDAHGRITRIRSEVNAPPHDDITLMDLVARCIESHVRLIQFGEQASTTTDVVVPLTFHPGGIPID